MHYVPKAGPLLIDCRTLDVPATMLRVRLLVSRIQGRACRVQVRIDDPDGVRALQSFARRHLAPYEVDARRQEWYVQLLLLPDQFGEPPRASVREAERQRLLRRSGGSDAGTPLGPTRDRSAAA